MSDPVDRLKECPFCDKKDGNLIFEEGRDWARIVCLDCSVSMEYIRQEGESADDKCEGVIKRWNTRKK